MTAEDSEVEKKKNILFVGLLLTNPSPTSIRGGICLGPEGVPWIKVPQYNKSVSTKNCMAYVILGNSFVNPAPLPPENVKCKNVNFCSTLAPSTRIRSCLKTEIFFTPFFKTSASTRCGFESFLLVHTKTQWLLKRVPSLKGACAFTSISARDVIVFKNLRFRTST